MRDNLPGAWPVVFAPLASVRGVPPASYGTSAFTLRIQRIAIVLFFTPPRPQAPPLHPFLGERFYAGHELEHVAQGAAEVPIGVGPSHARPGRDWPTRHARAARSGREAGARPTARFETSSGAGGGTARGACAESTSRGRAPDAAPPRRRRPAAAAAAGGGGAGSGPLGGRRFCGAGRARASSPRPRLAEHTHTTRNSHTRVAAVKTKPTCRWAGGDSTAGVRWGQKGGATKQRKRRRRPQQALPALSSRAVKQATPRAPGSRRALCHRHAPQPQPVLCDHGDRWVALDGPYGVR